MAGNLVHELRLALSTPETIDKDPFGLLRSLSRLADEDIQKGGENPEVQELVLRALEHRDRFGAGAAALDGLVRQRGLFPYLRQESLSIADSLAYEYHSPVGIDGMVFHRAQAAVYQHLMSGDNVVLSAPTSFGKSIIIDALVASERYRNVVIVVPTIALIDETRRRMVERFRGRFKVITHASQERASRNIFVLTQERVVDSPLLEGIDLFVIDEFYKLDPRQDEERAALLNQAFYRLYNQRAQFYLLGPNIKALPPELPQRIGFRFIATDYATVVSEVTRISAGKLDRQDRLTELWEGLDGPTLIYCASPPSARRVALALASSGKRPVSDAMSGAADWVSTHYHEDWTFVRALRRGIGLHHGKVPRALQQHAVRAFNEGSLNTLVCTSTLIEGVNTKAKNVIVFDNRIAMTKFDFFTFNNIKGRSGRMFEHFVGRVYLFNEPPQETLPLVDIPVFTQPESAPESLLVQILDEDLSQRSRDRLTGLKEQRVLPLEVIRQNRGVDPQQQVALANALASDPEGFSRQLAWTGMPKYDELVAVCELLWTYFFEGRGRPGVASARQLAFKINRFRFKHFPRTLILEEMLGSLEPDVDRAVEETLDFLRTWATFQVPRYLVALDRIQQAVFTPRGLPTGNFAPFAAMLENSFQSEGIAALDEYGVPIQLAARISDYLGKPETLDATLERLRTLQIADLPLTEFERELLVDAQRFA